MNNSLSQPIQLKRSIRQDCPRAPLVFFITANALGWVVSDCFSQGYVKEIKIVSASNKLCMH